MGCWNSLLGAFAAIAMSTPVFSLHSVADDQSLERVFASRDLIILGDVKHGVADRVQFFSSEKLFASMAAAGVRHVAIEMPRVLGRQAMTVENEADVEIFAADVVRSGRWHFTDPDHVDEESVETQYRVARSIGRQALLAKRYAINPIFYDFNNPLGGFRTHNDPVYRCLANLSTIAWVRYALDAQVTKAARDAAIIRERFSHDDELAEYIEQEAARKGGGRIVVIAGYAHAVMPDGLAARLEARLRKPAAVVAVFKDAEEKSGFHSFLWQQALMIQVDLSRAPHHDYTIASGSLRPENWPGRFAAIDGARNRQMPLICHQWALLDPKVAPR